MKRYNVVIIGSGMGGATLAAILAANGVSVLMIERAMHPRFTIGESLVPETSLRIKLLAERFGIPELGAIASFHRLRDEVSPACGVKRSFAFVYHRDGEKQRGEESSELPTLTPPFGPDAHLFRQDVDSWLVSLAVQKGAEIWQKTDVEDVEIGDDGVRIQTSRHEVMADYIVDGSGANSLLANKYNLRDETPRFTTDTRGMFTHMVNVTPYDCVSPPRSEHGMPVAFSQSTLHHVFDGGWIWVIPFDNHKASTNSLCSVGLLLERKKFPVREGVRPEQEWQEITERFPSVREQFAHAKAVRPWNAAPRLQYSSSATVGDRFCLLPHAAGFIDPLYSSGLSLTVGAIDLIAGQLIAAKDSGAYDAKSFKHVEEFVQGALDHYDVIVSRSFESFASWETWDAWNRVWALGNYLGTWGPLSLLARWKKTHNRKFLDGLKDASQRGVLSLQHPEFIDVRDQSAADMQRVMDGEIDGEECRRRILSRIRALDFIPKYIGLGLLKGRAPTVFTMQTGARHVLWYQLFAPKKWRDYCSMSLLTYAKLVMRYSLGRMARTFADFTRSFRDVFFTWNNDWRRVQQKQQATMQGNLHSPLASEPTTNNLKERENDEHYSDSHSHATS